MKWHNKKSVKELTLGLCEAGRGDQEEKRLNHARHCWFLVSVDSGSRDAAKETIWGWGQMFVRSAVRSRGFGVALNTFLRGRIPPASCDRGDFCSDWKVEVKNHQQKKKKKKKLQSQSHYGSSFSEDIWRNLWKK